MKKEVLCTLGPASMNKKIIKRLESIGVNLLRINLSHTRAEDLPEIVKKIRSFTHLPICFDSEGAQVRTGNIKDKCIKVEDNAMLLISRSIVPGSSEAINFYPLDTVSQLSVGDFITIDFNSVVGQVVEMNNDGAMLKIVTGGVVGQNKAVTVERSIKLSPFTAKDIESFKIAKELNIKHVALSFANHASDVEELRKIVGPDVFIISKIECRNGLTHLSEIVKVSNAILIDRGDMSREVSIEKIPALQKQIIKTAKMAGGKVYVATNLLESMVKSSLPTRAEVNDIYNTLLDGADGLVLAAETAIGDYPDKSAEMVLKLIHEFESHEATLNKVNFDHYFEESGISFLPTPHGGKLVQRLADDLLLTKVEKFKKIDVDQLTLMDCEQIAVGTFSPIEGFLGKAEFESVLKNKKLCNGTIWTIPILFQIDEAKSKIIGNEKQVILQNQDESSQYLLEVEEVYEYDLNQAANDWFGTVSLDHPGVAKLFESGKFFVSGKITKIKCAQSPFSQYEFTPAQTRYVFAKKGWSKIVAFHTRNVVHRAHEEIQKLALDKSLADGLFISPVIGPKKKGDFLTPPIFKSYQLMIEKGYYSGSVWLGSFNSYPRYSGPREAVFTALCRKNMGCSHFIIGRDHTGVGNFYKANGNSDIFEELGDIGIEPVFFDECAYNSKTEEYESVREGEDYLKISGTQLREMLINKKEIPTWFMRDSVKDMLLKELEMGNELFF